MVNYGSISMDRRDLRSVSIIVILPKPSAVERSAATSHTIASLPELSASQYVKEGTGSQCLRLTFTASITKVDKRA